MVGTTAEPDVGDDSEIKRNVRQRSTWIRLVYMLILAMAWTIAEIVFIAVVVLQFLMMLFTGKTVDNLAVFGRNLAEYMAQIVRYQTFVTEELAFPFTAWPSVPEQKSSR